MTISKTGLLAAVLWLAAGILGAQSLPKDLPWAAGQLQGEGPWIQRLPQLLVRTWGTLPAHRLSEAEKAALKADFLAATLRSLDQQASQQRLALDKKRLLGPLPAAEPAATEKALADLEAKAAAAREGKTPGAEAPGTLALRPVWAPGRDGLPWEASDRTDLGSRSQALLLVTGTVRTVGPSLAVRLELYSLVEKRVLGTWEDRFSPDEAPDKMAEASDRFRPLLLGRPWAGLVVSSPVSGTRVKAGGLWHDLPWATDDLEPGTLALTVQAPGRPPVPAQVLLEPGKRTTFLPPAPDSEPDRIVLETDPAGASLYLDSQYLGPSPQTVDRPLATTRIRAQAPGLETLAWEIGPGTPSPSKGVLRAPRPAPGVEASKDSFYWSLAVFSLSLTSSAFVGAWFDEQIKLTNAYVPLASQSPEAYSNYQKAYDRSQGVRAAYAGSVVLTCGVFVWMMFELGTYLGAAQSTLP